MKKLLAVGVIVLFLGLAIAPSINANVSKATVDSEMVEITTEVCGINGVTPNTVSLSKEDAEKVEKLIDDIERRLDNVETREGTVEIFKEAVVELDKYGLLGGLSVKQAQKLVTGGYQNSRVMRVLDRISNRYRTNSDGEENYLCLTAGLTSKTLFFGPACITSNLIFSAFEIFRYYLWLLWYEPPDIPEFLINLIILMAFIVGGLAVMSYTSSLLLAVVSTILPFQIGGCISFGEEVTNVLGESTWHPSNGWLFTYGLAGSKTWSSHYYGQFFDFYAGGLAPDYTYPVGAIGFTGIKINTLGPLHISFYLGSTLKVKIGYDPPDY